MAQATGHHFAIRHCANSGAVINYPEMHLDMVRPGLLLYGVFPANETAGLDLRPAAIIDELDLLRPIYAKTAAYGHFGREDADFTWERTNRVEALQAAIR